MNLSTVSSLFKKTMQREKKIICDYYDTQKKYEVFFRRDNRSTSPQGKMRLYYENSQGIQIGTIYNYKNKNYLVVSQDAQDSEVYYTSLAVRCDTEIDITYKNVNYKIPFVLEKESYGIAENNVMSIVNGDITIYTGINKVVKEMRGNYSLFGGSYTVQNHFLNNNLMYFYLKREVSGSPTLTYEGDLTLQLAESPYKLLFKAEKNNIEIDEPTLTYASNDETVATVDVDGTMTLLKEGTVEVTTTWQEEKITCKTGINVVDNSVKPGEIIGTSSIQGGKNISYGKSKKYIAHFYDKTGKEVTGVEADWSISKPNSLENEVTMQHQDENSVLITINDNQGLVNAEFELSVTDKKKQYKSSTLKICIIVKY